MGALDVIFAAIVGVLAALAAIGALVYAVVWEVCAIRRTLAQHRRPRPAWHERLVLTGTERRP
jgi:hypothetical protein